MRVFESDKVGECDNVTIRTTLISNMPEILAIIVNPVVVREGKIVIY